MVRTRIARTHIAVFIAIVIASATSLSAHVVRGLVSPDGATAFISSPTSGTDAPVAVRWLTPTTTVDTGLRVACFYAANTSAPRVDRPGSPRVTSIGFELPGSPTGFSLLSASDGGAWEIVEGRQALLPGRGLVTLDFAIVAHAPEALQWLPQVADPVGIPPGQASVRGSGTRFCVSGPFPDTLPNLTTPDPEDVAATTIEGLLNGVVVAFSDVYGSRGGLDVGLWDSPLRAVPLYPPDAE
jgi:hypothetical protein